MEEVLTKIAPSGIEKYTYLFKSCPSLLHPIPYDKDLFDYKNRPLKFMRGGFRIKAEKKRKHLY